VRLSLGVEFVSDPVICFLGLRAGHARPAARELIRRSLQWPVSETLKLGVGDDPRRGEVESEILEA
jgi:hypothetical protein